MYSNASALCQPSFALSHGSILVDHLLPKTHVKPVQFSTAASNSNMLAMQNPLCELVEASSVCTSANITCNTHQRQLPLLLD